MNILLWLRRRRFIQLLRQRRIAGRPLRQPKSSEGRRLYEAIMAEEPCKARPSKNPPIAA